MEINVLSDEYISDKSVGIDPMPVYPPTSVKVLDKKIMLAMPWYKSASPLTSFCVAALADKRRVVLSMNWGDAFLVHSRNAIADMFLKTKLEWLLTVDDDMILPIGDAAWFRGNTGWHNYPEPFASFNAIDRLLSHGKSLVGATYFGKHEFANAVFSEGSNPKESEYVRKGPYNIVKPCRWVGTGCMLIHRTVFEDIEKRFPNLRRGPDGRGGQWFTSSEHHAMDGLRRIREILSVGPMDGPKAMKAYELAIAAEAEAKAKSSLGMGEDVCFCVRAKEAGHQPYVDLGLYCGHVGTYVYGHTNTSLKPK